VLSSEQIIIGVESYHFHNGRIRSGSSTSDMFEFSLEPVLGCQLDSALWLLLITFYGIFVKRCRPVTFLRRCRVITGTRYISKFSGYSVYHLGKLPFPRLSVLLRNIFEHVYPGRNELFLLKGPKHDQIECGFFYINPTSMGW
jgi:hypothetical protein